MHGSESVSLIIWSQELQVRDQLTDLLQGAGDNMSVAMLEHVEEGPAPETSERADGPHNDDPHRRSTT
jgi:hypothetical protein